jgi:hypothetical protein
VLDLLTEVVLWYFGGVCQPEILDVTEFNNFIF